jgi:hypothetical protein
VPITTPSYSPESDGLAEGFGHTFKRDYVNVHELRGAEAVLAQLGACMDDYNRHAPHSALGMRSPADYRTMLSATANSCPHLSSELGSRSIKCQPQALPMPHGTGMGMDLKTLPKRDPIDGHQACLRDRSVNAVQGFLKVR